MTVAALFLAILVVITPDEVLSHPLAPSCLRLTVGADGRVDALWRIPSARPSGQALLVPQLPTHCVPLETPRAALSEDRAAIEERWRVDCGDRGLVGSTLSVHGLSTTSTNVVVEVTFADGSSARALLHRGDRSFTIPAGQSSGSVFVSYLRLGVEHLLTGIDHVLFVLGLLLLLRDWRKLVQAITAFTLGHSLSLSLSVLGILRIPQGPVEIAIAVSILILALDIVRAHSSPAEKPVLGPVARWPWALCATFGLLHGLGFAGALAHAGLPDHAIPLSLFSFNVGIEIGQLAIVAVGLVFLWMVRKWIADKPRLTQQIPAYVIGSLSAYWVLARSLCSLGILP